MKQLLLISALVTLLGCGKKEESVAKASASQPPTPPKEIVEIVVEDFVGTYDVEVPTWGPARLVFLENGVGEYHNTATAGFEVITIKWKIVKKGFVKWECRISGQPFSAVYRHNPDGSITGGMGTFKKIKSPKEAPSKSVEIANPIVEKAIRKQIKKPTGELTEANLEKVTELYLNDTKITDAGLEDLTKLKNLTLIYLVRTKITDAGLKEVAKLQKLTHLSLAATKITDAGLEGIAKLQKLESLNLGGTKITTAGLKEVAKLQQLTSLDLEDSKITDAGLKEIAKLQKLESLNLSWTKITNAGLKDTAKMQQLTRLSLNYTGITDAGAAELKKAMPKCKIEHSYWE